MKTDHEESLVSIELSNTSTEDTHMSSWVLALQNTAAVIAVTLAVAVVPPWQ